MVFFASRIHGSKKDHATWHLKAAAMPTSSSELRHGLPFVLHGLERDLRSSQRNFKEVQGKLCSNQTQIFDLTLKDPGKAVPEVGASGSKEEVLAKKE